jgi:histidyl-tRNA synthetase
LNYYTGIIFEAKAPAEVQLGSIGGGGRYDDLTSLFDVPDIAGVGISFGVDRIYDVLEELQLFPKEIEKGSKVIFFNMGESESLHAFGIMQQLRSNGISCEMYHEFSKIAKQFSYAEKKNIEYAIIIGSKEIEDKNCLVKKLNSGIQEVVEFEKLTAFFNK